MAPLSNNIFTEIKQLSRITFSRTVHAWGRFQSWIITGSYLFRNTKIRQLCPTIQRQQNVSSLNILGSGTGRKIENVKTRVWRKFRCWADAYHLEHLEILEAKSTNYIYIFSTRTPPHSVQFPVTMQVIQCEHCPSCALSSFLLWQRHLAGFKDVAYAPSANKVHHEPRLVVLRE